MREVNRVNDFTRRYSHTTPMMFWYCFYVALTVLLHSRFYSILILFSHCFDTIFMMFSRYSHMHFRCCFYSVFVLFSHYFDIFFMLFLRCLKCYFHIVFTLFQRYFDAFSHYLDIVFILLRQCLYAVSTLFLPCLIQHYFYVDFMLFQTLFLHCFYIVFTLLSRYF